MIILVPMAGADDAFRDRGHKYCKPLVEIHGKPIIEHAWSCLKPLKCHRSVFVIRKEDSLRSHLKEVLNLMVPGAAVVQSDGPTAGAACTALLAVELIDPDRELIIANGDQLLHCDLEVAVRGFRERGLDAAALTFDSVHPRWSFVLVDESGLVKEAAEKRPISRHATAGFYYFRRGGDFIEAAYEMIRKDAHVNGGFYVCPTFNEMILRRARIGIHAIPREAYVSLATPQNVDEYEQRLGHNS